MARPTGRVSGTNKLTPNQQITTLGNGALPLQAISALSMLAPSAWAWLAEAMLSTPDG